MGFMLNFIIHNFKTRLQNYYLFDSSFCLLYNLSMRNIIDMLNDSKDVVYKSFNSKLIPNIDKDRIIGVRVPDIRKIAKKVNNLGIGDEFLNDLPHSFFEENMVHAILLNDLHDIETLINYLDKFLPFVDNWAVCDIIKPRIFKKYPDKVNFLVYGTKSKFLVYPFKLIYNCFKSLYFYIKIRPNVIITTGAHTAGPMCCIGKLFGSKIIYIETLANSKTKTVTGRLIYHFADLFIVQWEEMLKLYPKAKYGGWIY